MAGPSLRAFQQWMKTQILPGAVKSTAESPLNPQRGTPGDERMRVYAGGYLTRIYSALEEVFEATHQVLGDAVFHALAEDYARQFPSQDYNLSFAGRHLPEYLRSWKRAEALPFLADLALLEWRVCEAFHAFEQPAMNPAQLSAIAPDAYDHLQLFFQPSVSVVASAWPILDIWQARKVPRETININLIDRPQRVLIYRRDVQVVCEPINPAQQVLLGTLLQEKTLGDACGQLPNEEAAAVSDWFSYWMSLGLIVRCAVAIQPLPRSMPS